VKEYHSFSEDNRKFNSTTKQFVPWETT